MPSTGISRYANIFPQRPRQFAYNRLLPPYNLVEQSICWRLWRIILSTPVHQAVHIPTIVHLRRPNLMFSFLLPDADKTNTADTSCGRTIRSFELQNSARLPRLRNYCLSVLVYRGARHFDVRAFNHRTTNGTDKLPGRHARHFAFFAAGRIPNHIPKDFCHHQVSPLYRIIPYCRGPHPAPNSNRLAHVSKSVTRAMRVRCRVFKTASPHLRV
jgi:hypothetical protein